MYKSLTIDHINKRISIGNDCPEENGNVLEVDNVLSVNNTGNITSQGDIKVHDLYLNQTNKVPLPYYGCIDCSTSWTPNTSYNYFLATNNGSTGDGISHFESGFIYSRGSTFVYNTGTTNSRNIYASGYEIPAGVSVVEVSNYMNISLGEASDRRIDMDVQIYRNGISSAPTTVVPLGGVVTNADNKTYYRVSGSTIISVRPGDIIIPRFYTATANITLTFNRNRFTIKALA